MELRKPDEMRARRARSQVARSRIRFSCVTECDAAHERLLLIPNHFVSNPERIVFTLLYGLEFERNGCVLGGAGAIKNGRDIVASVEAGYHQKAHLIDEIRLDERPIDMAASFKSAPPSAKKFPTDFVELLQRTSNSSGRV